MGDPTQSVALSGQHAYALTLYGYWGGYRFNFDVFDLMESVQRASMPVEYSPCLTVDRGLAYLGGSEFRVLDLSDPAAPKIVGTLPAPDYVWDIAVLGSRAYLAEGWGLSILDISDPTSPTLVGHVAIPGPVWSISVNGVYACVTTEGAGSSVVDISDPASPSVVGTCALPGDARDIALRGSHAYVTDMAGLRVLDLTRPTEPRLVGSVDMPAQARALAISGARAYVTDLGDATHPTSLHVVDISHPMRPVIVNSVPGQVVTTSDWKVSDWVGCVAAAEGRVAVGGTLERELFGVECLASSGCADRYGYLDVRLASAYEPAPPGSKPKASAAGSLNNFAGSMPTTFALRGNDPNPFNPQTSIHFDLPRTSRVRIRIYDAKGHLVRTLLDGVLQAGRHQVPWQGRTERGEAVASGVYLVRMETEGFRQTSKITLLK